MQHLNHLSYVIFLYVFLSLTAPEACSGEDATITDDEGNTITFSQPFKRIISLYPAHTENLATLGALDAIIGVSTSDTFPTSIESKQKFSYRDNTEKFLAAEPDLILIRPMISRSQPELMAKLRQSGIVIVSLQPTSVTAMFEYWHKLGMLCGQRKNADKMEQQFKESIEQVQGSIPQDMHSRPKVYFESIHRKMKTFSPDAITIFALAAGGGVNIATDAVARNNSNIAPYGKERLLSLGQDIDIYLSQVGRMNRIQLDDIYKEPGFTLIKAVQTKSVYLIEEELVSRPTMRLLEGISKIQSILYPQTTG